VGCCLEPHHSPTRGTGSFDAIASGWRRSGGIALAACWRNELKNSPCPGISRAKGRSCLKTGPRPFLPRRPAWVGPRPDCDRGEPASSRLGRTAWKCWRRTGRGRARGPSTFIRCSTTSKGWGGQFRLCTNLPLHPRTTIVACRVGAGQPGQADVRCSSKLVKERAGGRGRFSERTAELPLDHRLARMGRFRAWVRLSLPRKAFFFFFSFLDSRDRLPLELCVKDHRLRRAGQICCRHLFDFRSSPPWRPERGLRSSRWVHNSRRSRRPHRMRIRSPQNIFRRGCLPCSARRKTRHKARRRPLPGDRRRLAPHRTRR